MLGIMNYTNVIISAIRHPFFTAIIIDIWPNTSKSGLKSCSLGLC